jgi:uncharacterized protein (TIGR03435 family)
MNSTDRELRDLIDRHLKWPSDLAYMAARDRVREELLATPAHLQTPRIADAPPEISVWRLATAAAAAAVVALAVGAAILWPKGPQLYTAGTAGSQITLEDGSQIEMRARAELTVEREEDGLGIRLHKGDIIVTAAKQRDGHLYVHTRDMTIAVVGTVFLVNAGSDGSRVAVIEGEVRVREGDVEKRLRRGEQMATSPTIAHRPVTDDIDWTRQANVRRTIRELFMKGMAQTAGTLAPVAAPGQVVAAAGPEFEEASIRECDPDNLPPSPVAVRGGGANSVMMTPGRYYALCVTPATLIRMAHGYRAVEIEALLPGGLPGRRGGRAPILGQFGVVGSVGAESGRRVRGGPDWVRTERFTIEAVANEAATSEAMSGPMLRALFERRFKLKMHVETEQTPAYDLVVAPGGLKIKPVTSGACEMPVGAPGAPMVNGMPQQKPRSVADERAQAKPTCGVSNGPNGPNWVSRGGEATFGELTQVLRIALGSGLGVTDKTGITAKFNWDLEAAVDANTPRPPVTVLLGPPDAAGIPKAPTIFDALEEQLGLRLQPVHVPREYIVIDAIERPTAN